VNENEESFEIFSNIQFLKMKTSKLINHFVITLNEAAPHPSGFSCGFFWLEIFVECAF
jgi:hypothetical protein